MKKTMTKLFFTATFGLFASLAATAASGDIWSITRCNEFGVDQTGAATTSDAPFPAGEPLYFKIRLQARDADSAALGSRWYINYFGAASQIVADALTPMQIGIYVSGRLDYATYETSYNEGEACTAVIFKYVTKPGDFAMPIRLATATGPAGDVASSTSYFFNPLRSFWDFSFDLRDSTGTVTNTIDKCNWTFKTEGFIPESMSQVRDYSLEKCGFFVKTIDFSDDAEDPEFWRSIHENSHDTGGDKGDPCLAADAGPEETTTLYVWSEDESVVYIEGGVETSVDPNDPSVKRKVGAITFTGGQISQKFKIWGVQRGLTTNIVLSAYNHYNYSLATGDRLQDYLTAKVKCIEPKPATIRISRDDATVIAPTAGDDKYLSAVTRLTIEATQAPKADVNVTIKTVFQIDTNKTDWAEYVRFSTDSTVDTLPDGNTPPVVKLTPTDYKKYIYVYALRAESAYTIGTGKQVQFKPEVDPAEMAAAEITGLTDTGININANPPIITAPIGGDDPIYTVTAGEKLEIPVAVNDTYADMTDTTIGYKVRIKASGSSTAITMPVNYTASGEGGLLESMDTHTSPSVTYPSTPGDVVTTVEVYSPIRKLWSAVATFKVTVTPAKTSSAEVTDDSSEYIEGSTVHYKVSLSDAPSGNVYAFLYNYEESPAGTFGGTGAKAIITDLNNIAPGSQGIQITSVGTEAKGSFMVLDGISADDGGSTYTFGVVLCTSKTFNPANRVEGYPTTDLINITVYNKDPTFLQLYLNGFESDGDGYTFPNEYPKGQLQTIQPEFDDVSYDLDHGFIYKWTIKKDGKDVTNGIVRHDDASNAYDASSKTTPTIVPTGTRINTASFSYSFPNAGTYEVRVQMRDKDMSRFAAEDRKFFVTIIDQPQVQIEVEDMYLEMTARDKIHVGLGYFPDSGETVIVKLTITPPAGDNAGVLTLDNTYKTVPAGYDPLADNEYYVPFTAAGMQDILIEAKDGTLLSSTKGFTITGEVMNETESIEPGVAWKDYYRPFSVKAYIENETPIFTGVTLENTNAWKVAGGAATSYPIRFQIKKDVDEDIAGIPSYPGIKVTIMGCDSGTIKPNIDTHPNPMEFYVTTDEPQAYTFTPNFGSMQGEQTVTLMIEDKDGGSQTWTYLYMIEPSKFLTTIQNGPTGTGNSPLSQKYVLRTGRGQGHIFVPSAVFSDGARWRQNWNCSSATKIDVYGWGYRVGAVDNGWLNDGQDVALSTTGVGIDKAASADVTAGFYPYPDAERDSFLYCWLIAAPQTEGGAPDWTLYIAPEKPLSEPEPATAYLPTDLTGDEKSYIPVDVEGVFALEWLPADNCGDMNQDGVPDIFAMKADWAAGNLIEIMGGDKLENDLLGLASTNPDEDLLPGIYRDSSNSYAPIGIPFTTQLELRGLDDGLNAIDVTLSDVSFSKIEQAAWEKYANDNGLDPDAPDLHVWSPEPRSAKFPRMDPTSNDTDSDQFEDGWEYFFWYQAQVWVPGGEGKPLGKPRDGQHFVFERFNPLNIIVGTEIPAAEVLARFDPCTPYDPEKYDDPRKFLKYDFDHDGLSDLEEQLIGTNPCHWDTDGDRLCDSWEVMMCLDPLAGSKNDNPDGDFMAFHSVRLDMCWIDPADAATYAAEIAMAGEGLPEDLRIYGLPDLRRGIDYDIDATGKYIMLQTMDVVSYSFNPKWLGGEQLTYGLKEDIPLIIPPDWVWGWYMVDNVICETIHLNAGDEIFPDLQFVLIHDQVHDGFGFDPRTGWHVNANGYVTDRWDPGVNDNISIIDVTGLAVNTRAYANYDEYLVMKYRVDYGLDYSPLTKGDDPINPNDDNVWAMLQAKTTNPNNVYSTTTEENEEEAEGEDGEAAATTNQTATASVAQQFANAAAAAGRPPVTTHGADTDQDGVPDGWELYMYRNPNGAPISDDEDGLGLPMALDFDGDELSFAIEYAGTDSCNAYRDCPSIYANHPGNKSKWFNKFFPTNPGTMKLNDATGTTIIFAFVPGNADGADTDLDGVTDSMEGGAWASVFANGGTQVGGVMLGFVYGNPTDDGLTVCFRGGGMNPCTMDTDLDGIPDGWEMQHAGVPVQLPGKTVVDPEGGDVGGIELDAATFIADGINNAANLPEAVYIAGGMDATWKGDAVFDDMDDPDMCLSWDDLLNARRDVDFDHDGLQNYQEYLTQSVRHFRYDDLTTPLMGRQFEEGTYDPDTKLVVAPHSQSFGDAAGEHDGTGTGYPVFDPADPETFAANAAEAWNGRSFVYYQTVTTGVRDVIKVVNSYTGETSTNRIYYTAQKKMVREGATLVAQHVASGGSELQYAWTADGWRDAGYFSAARHAWDRAVASKELAAPIYMWPITGVMVGYNSSIAGYATTDPRISDTDGDGMDDFYEMYHGLNPLLGTTPATAVQTDWGLEGGSKCGDIISAQFWVAGYPLTDSRPTFNAWYNEWIYPRYSGLLGRFGSNPGDEVGGPIQAPQAYDPVLYPWSMGIPMVDADGDGMRNDEERIIANVADPVGRHTDPSPLWFTERTTPASYVAQYYVQSPTLAYMPWTPSPLDNFEEAAQRVMTDATTDIYFAGTVSYQYSFEENEGYDTDGDMTPDEIEVVSTVRKSSDPLRFDDPARSQAFYLPGENSYAVSRDLHIRPIDSVDFLKQFTVECWVLPEKQGVAQTIIDRAVAYEGNSINTDKIAIRSNFRIGLDAQGKVYGMFDNNDSIESGLDAPKSCQFVDGGPLPLNEWSHVALTFDGSMLMIYVNGIIQDREPTQLIPANGVTLIYQDTAATNSFPASKYRCDPSALLIGARPKKQNLYALYPYYIEGGLHMESFENLQEYFQGYVDEVRVWDGARTGAQISENFRKMIGFTQASENRDEVFESWYYNNGTRNNNDGNPALPPELVLNYDFSTLPGAVNEGDVAKTPAGFTKNVLYAAMSDYSTNPDIDTTGLYPNLLELKGAEDGGVAGDLLVGWWSECEVKSEVYTDYHVVPWIKNTVSHLPLIDGGAVDSFMYGDQFGSVYMSASDLGIAKLVFPNTAMPYPATVFNNDRYYRIAHSMILAERRGTSFDVTLGKSRFQVRNSFIGTADLVPMGGAFAKTCKKMWNDGASDPWEQTRDDTNGDGIPDWWEEYARHNYASDLDPSEAIGWDTMIDYHGARIPAGKAYVIDIYRGMQPDGTIDPDYAVNTDEDGDNLPDWWENLFGVAKYGADDDPDNDGLSNYDEYLFSFGATPYGMENGFPFLDPARQRSGSGQKVTDYFLAGLPEVSVSADGSVTNIFANQYLGEIATDHDFMEGWWEKTFSNSYANQYVYDSDKDTDGDGWDNFSENRAATWYGTLLSDSITRYLSDQVVLNNYPQPAIGLRFTYNGGIQDISGKSVVVRTMTKANGRTDATFTVVAPEASNVGVVAYTPGAFIDAKTPIHGFLQPGNILPQSCYIYGVHLSKEGVYFWGIPTTIYRPTPAGNTYPVSSGTYISNMTLTTGNGAAVECWYFTGSFTDYISDVRSYGRDNVMLDNPALDFELIGKALGLDDGRRGDAVIVSAQTAVQTTFGSFNFLTGEFSLDPAPLEAAGLQPDGMLVKLEYEYAISAEWPQTLWLNQPTIGRVKQGLNTIEAWMDLNGDGVYTAGEPYGVIRNVNIGWHKTAEMVLELKDTSSIIPHYLLSDGSSDRAVIEGVAGGVMAAAAAGGEGGGLTAKVAVRRASINGQQTYGLKTVPARTLVSKSYILDDRAYLTEADVLTDDKFDLDWKWLVSDAAKLGLTASDINTVEYEIDSVTTLPDGSVTNIAIATFVNRFSRQRPVPVTRAPLADSPVYSAAPTFSWTCSDDTMTAFRLQVSTSTNATDIVYDTGIRHLPGSDSFTVGTFGYSFTAPIYAGAPVTTNGAPVFLDGSNYFWRVTEFNAKYNDVDPKYWSTWTQFQMDVANENINPRLPTGYGRCGAIVRYYGPNTNDLTGIVVVEAHQSADFAGQPLAQMRADVSQLADRDDLKTTNAEFAGIEPGTVYLMAYIDTNNNGKRDVNESWGYANYVGTEALSLFTPQGVKVTDEILRSPSVVIYIEDTDFNRNEILDCIENVLTAVGAEIVVGDGDRDGLLDDEEDGFATDPSVWDTDGDGMPDGWEVKFADLDPTFFDAVEAADSDVMAFVTNKCTIVTVQNTDGSEPVKYILKDGQGKPVVGDSIEGYELYEIYDYPVATENGLLNCYGRGALVPNLVADAGTTNRVMAVTSELVALVHAQVYKELGFNPKTANPTAYAGETAVNTKPFTALDKYLLVRYFASLGICDEDDVNVNGKWAQYSLKPFDSDNDKDGTPDGWELYVMFGPNEMTLENFTNGTAISAWNFDDRESDGDDDNLPLYREFDVGSVPTNPWQEDTDGDGITDDLAWKYHLKGTDSSKDFDNDGLANYVEYLLREVFAIGEEGYFDPDDAFSTADYVSDYFFKLGQLYVGDVFTDHDRISDQWERIYQSKSASVSPYHYDADLDPDGDGWSNYSEFQAGTDPTKLASLSVDAVEMDEYPVPTVELTIAYLAGQPTAGKPIVVKAWRNQAMTTKPDAVWTLGGEGDVSVTENGNSNVVTGVKYFGMNPMREMLVHLSPGSVVPNSVKFEFKDLSWVLYNETTGQAYLNDPITATWNGGIIAQPRNDGSGIGDIVSQDEPTKSLGTIDFATGEMKVDFAAFPTDFTIVGDIAGRVQGYDWYSIYNLQKSYIRVNWQSKLVAGGKVATYYLSKPDVPSSDNNSYGSLREGLNTFVAFYDIDGNGEYTPGEPYGFARDVDVGWNYAKASIELTDTSAISPRYNLTAGGSAGATGAAAGNTTSSAATDRETIWEASADDIYDYLNGDNEEALNGAAPALHAVRVRVARIAVDGFDINAVSNALNTTYMATLYDRVLDLSATGHPVLTEADILSDPRNEFDIDWNAAAETAQKTLLEVAQYYALTNVYYGVFVGNGVMQSSNVTNGMMLAKVFVRKFMPMRSPAVPQDLPQVINAPAPTFKWRDPESDATYTAFKIRIKSGSTTIWTSNLELMPPRDAEGYHTWTPPLRVGAIVPGGTAEFKNGVKYTWEIATYNAKFSGDPTTWAKPPAGGEFYMNALTASPDYATVNVAVRYFGPSAVINKNYPIRVQAFTTPDFSGDPVGEGYVTDKTTLGSTDEPTIGNARIVGLSHGTYYIRAFFDAVNDGKLTTLPYSAGRWESWGCLCSRDNDVGTIYTPKSVTIGPELGGSPAIAVYIDDCDTDQDTLPDIWEYATKSSLTTLSATSIDQVAAGFTMKKELTGTVQTHGDLTSGLAVNLKSARLAALMLNVDATGDTDELGAALAAVDLSDTVEPTSVVITSIEFDRESGKVTVVADTEGTKTSSTSALQIYEFPEGNSPLTLTLKLWFNSALDQNSWVEVGAKKISIDRTSGTYTYDIGDALDLSSGFFKVSLEK